MKEFAYLELNKEDLIVFEHILKTEETDQATAKAFISSLTELIV